MTCTDCQKRMTVTVGTYDYTRLAALRGKSVVLDGVRMYVCSCGREFVEIPRIAELQRAIDASRMLTESRLRLVFDRDEENGWVVVIPVTKNPYEKGRKD